MRFTDGYWMPRAGFTPLKAAEAYDVDVREGPDGPQLVVTAPTRVIERRGDTLNRTVLTVVFDSPAEGVVRTRISHHDGGLPPRPTFGLAPSAGHDVQVGTDAGSGWLRSGRLTVRVRRGAPWSVEYLDGEELLTRSQGGSVAYVEEAGGGRYVHEQLSLGVGEHLYGLGERFGAFVKNGQTVDVWNADGGTSSEQAYKNVPFYLSDRGYGVFVDHPEQVSFEIGSEVVSRTQFSVEGEFLQYLVIAGPEPKDVLRRYTALTGRPPQVPAWSYGLWLSTSFTTSYDETTVMSFIDGMAQRNLPLSVFHFDCFWMREFNWCDFEWDPRTFPDPEGMLRRLHDRDLKVCVWINPYIAQRSPLFAEAAAQGFLLQRTDGSVWQWDMWQAGMGLVDFTNPAARQWFRGHLDRLQDMGVDSFKTDFGERIPTEDVVWHDGSDPQRMHNYYAQLYNDCVFGALRERRGAGDAVVFARAATAGGQQFPVHWGGDCYSTFEAMAETLRGGLSLAASGFGYWSHDIGGFEGTPDPRVFKRWLAFGLLSSHSRLHGSTSYRVPWAFDEEAVEVARRFTELKMSLMPYLLTAAGQAQRVGTPVIRPMFLEFSGDRAAATLDTQYMLGPDLLVAPVFSADDRVACYVPAGRWHSLLTGEEVPGGRWIEETHDVFSLPLLVRPGTVLPVGARRDRPDYDYADGVELRCFALQDGARVRVEVPDTDGAVVATFTVTREGDRLVGERSTGEQAWSLSDGTRPGTAAHADASTSRLEVQLPSAS
ncbi:alpha-xylosidase [Kineococcus sp. SYSU DK003]|uniref:alpha-xylosidase n=1 Tax=Kineococcus sp. SYSU DK003 TaxID=3383124 RepID=UPI003D7DC085